ncbi:MAG: response regulator [Acidobacteriales bacterium]|nr:response regulator [Terriglobales bacterium]
MPVPNARILVVDDEAPIRDMLDQFLSGRGYTVEQASDGVQALERLAGHDVELVVTDIRMPVMGGLELLGQIATKSYDVGVVVITACDDVASAVNAMKCGALDYVSKPFSLGDLDAVVARALSTHRNRRRDRLQKAELEALVNEQARELRQALAQLHEVWDKALDAMVAALDAREHEPESHSKRVSEYAAHLASTMGVDPVLLDAIRRGAMLHDIGKIGIPDNILLKPGELTPAEWVEMRKHPRIGFWILSGIEVLKPACQIVLTHHENFDGSGYPDGLKGDAIPIGSRIFSVVDSFDAMTSHRPYRKAMSYERARKEIEAGAGAQYDPEVVRGFLMVKREAWASIRERTAHKRTRPDPVFMRLFKSAKA